MGQNKKGYKYEDFVFKCFNAIYAWMNNCPDLKNSFKIEKGVKMCKNVAGPATLCESK